MTSTRWGAADTGRFRRKRLTKLLATLAALALLLAACGSDDDSASETAGFGTEESEADFADEAGGRGVDDDATGEDIVVADGAAAPPQVATTTAEAEEQQAVDEEGTDTSAPDADGPLGAGGTTVTPTAADLGRKLIFTAFIEVGVDDVAAASAEATSIVEGMGGFLFGQNTTGGTEASSELVFKVLPDDFNRILEQLGSVGELRNQSVFTDDVTERIVDLESRIQVADLGVARLRAALEGAATLEDYAEIERLLLDRESNLEVMRGQLRTLQDRVDLATITLLLTQDRVQNGIDLRISAYEGHDGGQSCGTEQGVNAEAGADVTICFDVVNIGDQTLTNFVLTDTVLDIDAETQLIPVFGELDELAPGQSALVAYEFNPERTARLRTRVVAVPTDGVTSDQVGPSVTSQVSFDVRTFEPESSAGFGDGFSVGVDILKGLWVALTVTIGFLVLPLLVLVPLAVLARWLWKQYRTRRPPKVRPPAAPRSQGPGPRPGPGPGPGPGPQGPGPGGYRPPPPTGSAPPPDGSATPDPGERVGPPR